MGVGGREGGGRDEDPGSGSGLGQGGLDRDEDPGSGSGLLGGRVGEG